MAERLRVFISYARADAAAFAEELLGGLEILDFDAFLDRHDISGGEEWEARLGGLIESADTIVFVLTPASVKSPRCQWEVDRAQALSKRVIPIVLAPVQEAETPDALKRLNYIFFTPDRSFARSLGELATALRVDLGWVREHTRLWEHARRWHDKGRADFLLLRGGELEAAHTWLAAWRAPAPEPSDLHRALIAASEDAQGAVIKRERDMLRSRSRVFVFAVLMVGLVLAAFPTVFYLLQQNRLQTLETQVAREEALESRTRTQEVLAAYAHFQTMAELDSERRRLVDTISSRIGNEPRAAQALPRYSAYRANAAATWFVAAENALREDILALEREAQLVQSYAAPTLPPPSAEPSP